MYEVTDIQRFCIHDGPGVRTTVFLRGCPLHCLWCHNPETANDAARVFIDTQLCLSCGACAAVCPQNTRVNHTQCTQCGACATACPTGALTNVSQRMDHAAIVRAALRDAAYYGDTGGVTLSGGEPLMDFPNSLKLLTQLKAAGLHTCVETSGAFHASDALLDTFAAACDHVLFDVKDTDGARLQMNTGATLASILANLHALDARGITTTLRAVLLGFNANLSHADALAAIYASLQHCTGIDLIPYHPYGNSKAARLGSPFAEDASWPVSADAVFTFAARLAAGGVPVHTHQS